MAKIEFGIDGSEKLSWGALHFKAKRDNDHYLLAFHLRVPVQENYRVKAVKVTFEPSGTIGLVVFEEKFSKMERRDFLLGQTPLSLNLHCCFTCEVPVGTCCLGDTKVANCRTIK